MEKLLAIVRNQWNALTSGQRIVLFSMIAAFTVSTLVFSLWVRNPEMSVLTSGASMSRAGEIVGELESRGVKYKVTHGGRTILVDRQMASELAVTLAAEGLIGDEPGGKILDSKNVGMWPTEILRDNLRRVLQAELGKMIAGLRSVESAQVQLALPEESVFVEDEQKPTASVLVRLRAGGGLSPTQVRGIANLVSAGVEGLEPNNVSIVDSNGDVLWGDDADSDQASMARLQKKKEIEKHLAEKATHMLTRVVGPGNAIVSVNVALGWDQMETKTTTFDPARSSVRSEQRDESTTDGNTAETSVTNFELDETSQFVLSKGAKLEQLTASVAVNYRETVDGQGAVTYEKLPDADLNDLQTLVMNAVGFDQTRGDRITVVNHRFNEVQPLVVGGGFFSSPLVQMAPSVLGKLIAIAITLFLLLSVKKQLSSPGGASASGSGSVAGAILSDIAGSSGGEAARVSSEDRFQTVAQGNPENVARVMKSWMSE